MPYGLPFLIHLSMLFLVTPHQIRNKKWNIRENFCICTAVLVSVLFRLHSISGLSFSGDVLLPASLLFGPFKQPFLIPISLPFFLVHPIFGPFLTELAGAVFPFTVP
jgi:hypothetical protein